MLNCPRALQVSTPLFEHRALPGEQLPAHAPATHAWFVHATGLLQAPVGPQVSTPFPTHWVSPGTHAAQPPFRQMGVDVEQVTGLPH